MSRRGEPRIADPPEDRLLTVDELDACEVSVTIREIRELRRDLGRALRKLRQIRATKQTTLGMRHVEHYLGLSMQAVRRHSGRMRKSLPTINGFQGWRDE